MGTTFPGPAAWACHSGLCTSTKTGSQGSVAFWQRSFLAALHCLIGQACLHDDAFEGALQRAAHNGSCLAPHALQTLDNQSAWALLVLWALESAASVPAQRQLRLADDQRNRTCRRCPGAGAGALMKPDCPCHKMAGQLRCTQPCHVTTQQPPENATPGQHCCIQCLTRLMRANNEGDHQSLPAVKHALTGAACVRWGVSPPVHVQHHEGPAHAFELEVQRVGQRLADKLPRPVARSNGLLHRGIGEVGEQGVRLRHSMPG